jgi:DNA-binding transcriptional LysR family regulator
MNLDSLRAFLVIVEEGSLNQAAGRLRVSQSTLTRQMQALEQALGGPLLERGAAGVAPTAAGHALVEGLGPALAKLDHVLGEVRKRARGQSAELRIGYLQSAVAEYLNPALVALRRSHPEVKPSLRDLSPGEQIAALRRGELDVALLGAAEGLPTNEFYVKRIAPRPMLVALAAQHPLAARATLSLAELKAEHFIGAADADLPGYNRWVTRLCRRAGFRVRFAQEAESLGHGFLLVVTEGAVSLLPDFAGRVPTPGVAFVPLADPLAKWELLVAWQRGKISPPLRTLLQAIG